MSSTRRATDGLFHQERFCSSPEFEGDAGLQQLCEELGTSFPEHVGTPTLRKLIGSKRRVVRQDEIRALRKECGIFDDDDEYFTPETIDRNGFVLPKCPAREFEVEFYQTRTSDALSDLPQILTAFCLDPKADVAKGVWFFSDLLGALAALRERFVSSARSRLADTIVTRRINETLDFWFSRRRMVLIEGVAGIGRSETARAWCDAHAGLVRYVEVPSSSDDRSFFASMARQLGVARGASFKSQQIKVRVEEMLATSGLALLLDESQYLFGQYIRPRRTPDRLLWVKTVFDAGTPIGLVAHVAFSKCQAIFVQKTLWSDEQFERRVNRRITLPTEHSKQDMIKIARAHHPGGDMRSWKLLASYALGTEKKQASGVTEALESARYRAEKAGRNEAIFADIEAALIHDHCFLKPDTASAQNWTSVRVTAPAKSADVNSDFPIRGGPIGSRITTPVLGT